jgi:hypothetical protein
MMMKHFVLIIEDDPKLNEMSHSGGFRDRDLQMAPPAETLRK